MNPSSPQDVLTRFFRQLPGSALKHHALASALQGNIDLVQSILYLTLAEAANKEGEHFTAHELAQLGLSRHQTGTDRTSEPPMPPWPLKQQKAIALARSGAYETARRQLIEIVHSGDKTASMAAIGPLARTYRDEATQTSDPNERKHLLREGLALALEGARHQPNAYNTGQAAQFSFLLGSHQDAQRFAEQTRRLSQQELDSDRLRRNAQADTFWHLTNLAEMSIIDGNLEEARRCYTELVNQHGPQKQGDLLANLKVCRILLAGRNLPETTLDDCFQIGSLCVFSGHMLDALDRQTPRFPERYAPAVRARIEAFLRQKQCRVAMCSLAVGGDILFAEAALSMGADLHVILRSNPEVSKQTSVIEPAKLAGANPEEWATRFQRVLEHPHTRRLQVLRDLEGMDGHIPYDCLNRIMCGTSLMRSRAEGLALMPVVLWDGQTGAPGGTSSFVSDWESLRRAVHVISPLDHEPREKTPSPAHRQTRQTQTPDPSLDASDQSIKALLFTDVVGYSKLPDRILRPFSQQFFEGLHRLIESIEGRALHRNTWGDALFMVYDKAAAAAELALKMRDWMKDTPWHDRFGIPQGLLRLRTGLHYGAVHHIHDPITNQMNYTGSATSLAARIEPIAEEGQIFCTGEFAAALALEDHHQDRFRFEYQGVAPLPKKAGSIPVYRLAYGRLGLRL